MIQTADTDYAAIMRSRCFEKLAI